MDPVDNPRRRRSPGHVPVDGLCGRVARREESCDSGDLLMRAVPTAREVVHSPGWFVHLEFTSRCASHCQRGVRAECLMRLVSSVT